MRLALLLALALPLAACADDASGDDTTDIDPGTVDGTVDIPADIEAGDAADIERVNLNTGTEEEFLAIPDVGDRMVHEFEEYRPYTSIQQFRREIGKYVDEDQVAAYEQYVFVPVDIDAADAETLRQLPGVGAAEAVLLTEGRPYGSNDAFLDAYEEAVPGADREAAASYLAD